MNEWSHFQFVVITYKTTLTYTKGYNKSHQGNAGSWPLLQLQTDFQVTLNFFTIVIYFRGTPVLHATVYFSGLEGIVDPNSLIQ